MMQCAHKFWTLCSVGIIGFCPAIALGNELDFASALRHAKDFSSVEKRSQILLEQVQIAASIADDVNDPQFSVRAAATRNYREAASASSSISNEQSYGLNLSIPVYDFGRSSGLERELDQKEKIAAIDKYIAELKLVGAVARSYADVVSAQRSLNVAIEQQKIAEEKLTTLTKNYRMGLRPETDVVQAQVDAGRAKMNRKMAEDQLRQERRNMSMLTGLEEWSVPQRYLDERDPTDVLQLVQSWQKDQKSPAEQRLEFGRRALEAELDQIKSSRWPVLAASISAAEVGNWQPLETRASAALALDWKIPWNGQNRSEQAQLVLKLRELELDLQDLIRTRTQKISSAQDALAAAVRQWADIKDQLLLVNRQLQLIQNRYDSGKASALEVSTAQSQALGLKLDMIRIMNSAAVSAIEIAEQIGKADMDTILDK